MKIRFSVDGDLSAEELAAIRSVVAQASGLAAELFAGDAPEAFATAAGLEIDGAQLARVALRLSVREHLTYAASGSYRPAPAPVPPAQPEALEPAPSAPAADPPANAETQAAETPAPAAPAAPSGEAVDVADGAAEPAPTEPAPVEAPAPAAPPVLASSALDTIARFLAHLLDALAEPPPAADADAPSIALSLKLRVFKSVALTLSATQVRAPDETTSGMPLLADTLDALAAHEEPLDARA